jgi:3-oxoadipyl-CoA thiolase
MPLDRDDSRNAVLVSACRTPVTRLGGALASVRPDDLAALVIREAVERAGVAASDIEDVVFGAANQAGEDNRNVARMALLLAGLPNSVAGQTVNRLCGSGLQAIVTAGHAIAAGEGDVFVAGGVESMTRAPYVLEKAESVADRSQTMYDTTLGWRFPNKKLAEIMPLESMGETGENVAEQFNVTRERQDAFALASQQRWTAANDAGHFADELVPVTIPQRKGDDVVVAVDEHPRPQTTLETLAKLRPAFREGGTVTAGNSSGLNDGAAAVVLTSLGYAQQNGLRARARIVSSAVAGVDGRIMGIGPVPASCKALERAGLTVDDIDLVELNEAFAAQSLACVDELGLHPNKVNVTGGSIAMGHPLGSTGARLTCTMLHNLERTGGRYGLVTMCIGVGQGIAAVIERLD